MGLIVAVVVALVLAAVIYRVVQRGRDGSSPAGESGPEAAPTLPDWLGHMQGLVGLNCAIREHALPEAVIARLEHIFEGLRQLLPELNDSYAGSELCWTVNRMATDYLGRVVKPFVALSSAARDANAAEFLESLTGLENELENIGDLVRNQKVGDFKAKAAFLRVRFLGDESA